MKYKKQSTRSKMSVFRQLCNLIPAHLVPQLAREHGVERKARTFSVWSHVVTMLYSQFTHALSLNDVCDSLRVHCGPLRALRGATPPSRNALSHANKNRDASMMEALFWKMLDHLQGLSPGFGHCGKNSRMPRRFRRAIHIVDSTTIALIALCMDWAKHRRRKAAAKLHVRLELQSLLPRYVLVQEASHADSTRAPEVCAGLKAGEIVVFDRAYVDLPHLCALDEDGVFWVTRSKENMRFEEVRSLGADKDRGILKDEIVRPLNAASRANYPAEMRRVCALVEVDGKITEMEFLTNNLQWSPSSIAELYRCRWQIEVFFKQIKQTLQVCDFLGNSANAITWQVWSALLVYLLLRFAEHISKWGHAFSRLFTLCRSCLWLKLDLRALLESYGTAGGSFRYIATPQQAYFTGFA